MSLNVIIDERTAEFVAEPAYGRRVVFEVTQREVNVSTSTWSKRCAERFVVGLKGSTGPGFSQFTSFEKACAAALSRARRYERAYSVPRGVVVERGAA